MTQILGRAGQRAWRILGAAIAIGALACVPAHALVSFDDSRDHVFVTGTLGVARDSNIFANNLDTGDTIYTAGVLLEYTRKAGMIAVNASLGLQAGKFQDHHEENYLNPGARLDFVKGEGRTTGNFLLSAARQTQTDPSVNFRDVSWNYGAGLNARYPVIERYSLSASVAYALIDYIDNPNYVDLQSYSAGLDAVYQLRSDRELSFGYRWRQSDEARGNTATDHDIHVGVSGHILEGFTGSLRFGYQLRVPHGTGDSSYNSWTGLVSVTRSVNKRLSITAQFTKDFSFTATDISIDTSSGLASVSYTFNAHWDAFANTGGGHTKFIGAAGVDSATGRSREDTFIDGGIGGDYIYNDHFKVSVAYSWMENWSVIHYADFVRTGWNLTLSTRW